MNETLLFGRVQNVPQRGVILSPHSIRLHKNPSDDIDKNQCTNRIPRVPSYLSATVRDSPRCVFTASSNKLKTSAILTASAMRPYYSGRFTFRPLDALFLIAVVFVFVVAFGDQGGSQDVNLLSHHALVTNETVSMARSILQRHYLEREKTVYDVFGDRETRCAGVPLPEQGAAPRKMDQTNGGHVWYLPLIKRAEIPDLLNKLNLIGHGAEIGALRGAGAQDILSRWQGAKLILVDLWDAVDIWSHDQGKSHYDEMLGRMQEFPGRYEIEKGWSHDVAAKYPDDFFHFIYIDAGHSYLDVRKDLVSWWPKLKTGGLFAGHDY